MKYAPCHIYCRAPLHEECPKYHVHKEDPGVTPETCGTVTVTRYCEDLTEVKIKTKYNPQGAGENQARYCDKVLFHH